MYVKYWEEKRKLRELRMNNKMNNEKKKSYWMYGILRRKSFVYG